MKIDLSSDAKQAIAKTILEECEPSFDWEYAPNDLRALYAEVADAVVEALKKLA